MSKKTRNRFSVPEKVAILRLHLLEHTPVSDLCDQHGIHPTMFYRWQKEFFENAAAAFEHRSRRPSDDKDRRIALLDQRQLEFPPPLACLFTMWFSPQPKEGTVMIKDAQVRKLRQLLGERHPRYCAVLRVGMDAKSARKYRHADRLPNESLTPRTWRTREDPFQDVWPQLRDLLELNPGLQAKTLFHDLQRRFPGRFPDIQLRTLQRKIKRGEPPRVQPRRCFSIRSIGPASWLPPTSRTWTTCTSRWPVNRSITWSITSSSPIPIGRLPQSAFPRVSRASAKGSKTPSGNWEEFPRCTAPIGSAPR